MPPPSAEAHRRGTVVVALAFFRMPVDADYEVVVDAALAFGGMDDPSQVASEQSDPFFLRERGSKGEAS